MANRDIFPTANWQWPDDDANDERCHWNDVLSLIGALQARIDGCKRTGCSECARDAAIVKRVKGWMGIVEQEIPGDTLPGRLRVSKAGQ